MIMTTVHGLYFGQVNYDITEQLEASFALRYDEDKREQDRLAF